MATLSSIITPTNITTASNTQTLTNKTITGGILNGTLGATTPSTGAFSTLGTTGNATIGTAGIGAVATPTKLTLDGSYANANTPTNQQQKLTLISVSSTEAYGLAVSQDAGLWVQSGNTVGATGYIGFATGGTERARINSTGLAVTGTLSTTGAVTVDGLVTTQGLRSASNMTIQTNNANDDITLAVFGSSGYIILNGGNVGIANTTPAYTLSVTGTVGCSTTTVFTNYSDARLKTNVKNLASSNSSLLKIVSLRPVSFNWNELTKYDEATLTKRRSGFIAQELKEVFPEMVGTTKIDNVEYLDTNLSDLNLHLVLAIQELSARLAALESQ